MREPEGTERHEPDRERERRHDRTGPGLAMPRVHERVVVARAESGEKDELVGEHERDQLQQPPR